MEGDEFLASRQRAVVTEFIEAVVEEWACDMGQVERNILGVALRSHMETELVPGLLAIHALLLKADAEMLARLPEWLDRVQTPLPGSRDFFEEMARRLDPTGYDLLEESLGLLPGESETARTFTDFLWDMAPRVPGPSAVT